MGLSFVPMFFVDFKNFYRMSLGPIYPLSNLRNGHVAMSILGSIHLCNPPYHRCPKEQRVGELLGLSY